MYIIRATHHFYGPYNRTVTLIDPETGRDAAFANRADARAYVAEIDAGTYYQEHNEYDRPTYRIRKVEG